MASPGTPADPAAANDGPGAGENDVKRRFREALERKQGRSAGGSGAAESGDHSTVHGGAHGPAHQQRQFRRKSGG